MKKYISIFVLFSALYASRGITGHTGDYDPGFMEMIQFVVLSTGGFIIIQAPVFAYVLRLLIWSIWSYHYNSVENQPSNHDLSIHLKKADLAAHFNFSIGETGTIYGFLVGCLAYSQTNNIMDFLLSFALAASTSLIGKFTENIKISLEAVIFELKLRTNVNLIDSDIKNLNCQDCVDNGL